MDNLQNLRVVLLGVVIAAIGAINAGTIHAQAVPSAYRGTDTLWVGIDAAYGASSFPYQSGEHLGGLGVFVDFDLKEHLAIVGNAHFLEFGGIDSVTESSYLVGPRFRFRPFGKIQPYAQALMGIGKIHYPFKIGDAQYFDIAPGGGISYRLSSRLQFRAEYEYEIWVNSPGFTNEPSHQLRPNGVHVGIALRPFR